MSRNVAITGASGFVGRAVSRAFLQRGDTVFGFVRRPGSTVAGVRELALPAAVGGEFDLQWPDAVRCECVIHLAARVHQMADGAVDPLAEYRAINVEGALCVARVAHEAGVKRFVYVSSIKAVGERSAGHPLRESDAPAPGDPYGVSKLEAERALAEFGRQSGLEIVVVRPPLVYGPGVRANFQQMMRVIAAGVPLPLGAIDARRSLVFVDNLADALVQCAIDPRAAGETFHVTDGRDFTVAELARALAKQLGVPARLIPVPLFLIRVVGRLAGRSAQVDRLIGELRVDSSHIAEKLGWSPPHTVEQGLFETAAWYRSTH
ncbi:NAD-dependent dehydratase [Burkholderia ubonensis]|uniref:UDP-glucose 4-epimerase family protein n=1 Tax=Burkholderia ubonensis TaxID=101571 RepID=UPI000BA78662|nr:SDR family oxidoreductase [Burkholderia ubonensis]PAK10393.1 NAD-dependent dehydratase [Burkholderia ubonensis]RQP93962.1 NAD-dependent epimerase/dehydratase family protein [Burkholderia ubonensis]